MATQANNEVLWMADCYSLAKRFHSPSTWMALLQPAETKDEESLSPFNYWLWMEIWKAAHTGQEGPVGCLKA